MDSKSVVVDGDGLLSGGTRLACCSSLSMDDVIKADCLVLITRARNRGMAASLLIVTLGRTFESGIPASRLRLEIRSPQGRGEQGGSWGIQVDADFRYPKVRAVR